MDLNRVNWGVYHLVSLHVLQAYYRMMVIQWLSLLDPNDDVDCEGQLSVRIARTPFEEGILTE